MKLNAPLTSSESFCSALICNVRVGARARVCIAVCDVSVGRFVMKIAVLLVLLSGKIFLSCNKPYL